MSRPIDDGQVSPEDAERLLKRASELDMSRSAAISIEQLRQSAIDAGIDGSAFDTALTELRREPASVQQAPTPAKNSSKASLWGSSRLIPLLAIGLGTGALSRVVRPFANMDGLHLEALGSMILVNGIALFLVYRNAKDPRHAILQSELIALFGGLLGGWSLLNGGAWEDMTFVTALNWLGAAIVGGAVLWWSSRQRQAEQALPPISVTDAEVRADANPGSNRFEVRRGVEVVPA